MPDIHIRFNTISSVEDASRIVIVRIHTTHSRISLPVWSLNHSERPCTLQSKIRGRIIRTIGISIYYQFMNVEDWGKCADTSQSSNSTVWQAKHIFIVGHANCFLPHCSTIVIMLVVCYVQWPWHGNGITCICWKKRGRKNWSTFLVYSLAAFTFCIVPRTLTF